jgi:curved DNA-binding protein CbpA
MRRKTKKEVPGEFRACDAPGCSEHADYKAPKTREERPEYFWFCLDHVREYNKQWNYFEGMGEQDILAFMKDAVTGHRPTWYMSSNGSYSMSSLNKAFNKFMGSEDVPTEYVTPISAQERKALNVLELRHPTTRQSIKLQYRKLVKQYHPDVNRGDKDAEERFKSITKAYTDLMETYVEPLDYHTKEAGYGG